MDSVIIPWATEFVAHRGPFRRVLELGSRNINGTIRPAFSGAKYIGIDIIDGPDVDMVVSSHEMPYRSRYFDCVVATSFFEHDMCFWKTLREVHRVLKRDGWMIITVPFNEWGVHDYPGDYYRYMPEAIEQVLFQGFKDFHLASPIVSGTQIHGAWGRLA